MKQILVALLLLSAVDASYASHSAGGQVWYEYNGVNYTVHVSVLTVCEGGAHPPASVEVGFRSASKGYDFTRLFTTYTTDTQSYNCNNINGCLIPQNINTHPGHIIHEFTDTVSLPAANDWRIFYEDCCVNANVLNGIANADLAVFTTMDNTDTIPVKSSLYVPALNHFYITVNDTFSFPFQYVAGEMYDSVLLELVDPYNSLTTSIPYRSYPYTLTQPLGFHSLLRYDELPQRLNISCTTQGKFYLAFDIKGYRNGKVTNYSHIQTELTVMPTMPDKVKSIVLRNSSYPEVIACGGQSGAKKIVLEDAVTNDSVYIDVVYPNTTSAYNVSHSVIANNAKAEVTLNWTANTLSFAPQPPYTVQLDYGSVKNGCKTPEGTFAAVFKVTDSCSADSVWPGDADDDNIVTLKDVLAIGLNYRERGNQRHTVSNAWMPFYCFEWRDTWSNKNINTKYADCNGDGVVDTADLAAITANFSKTHPRPGAAKPTAGPVIYFDTTGIVFAPGATVSVPIKIGAAADKLPEAMYGWATDLSINGISLATPFSLAGNTGWLANNNDNLYYDHVYSNNSIGWAHSRTNGKGIRHGYGTLGTARFTIPAATTIGTVIRLGINNTVLMDEDGNEITNFSTTDTTAIVGWPVNVERNRPNTLSAIIAPNPAEGKTYLHLRSLNVTDIRVVIAAIDGQVIYDNTVVVDKTQAVALHAASWASGVYTVNVISENGATQHLKMVKL